MGRVAGTDRPGVPPIEDLLADAVSPGTKRVLDVGCGTGGTTVAVARRLGAGSATGIDISEAMIAAARGRAKPEGSSVTFIVGDAQTDPLEPGGFDAIVSRFGVMFFDDPIEPSRTCAAPRAPVRCFRLVAWRSAAENPFMTTAERAPPRSYLTSPPADPRAGPVRFRGAEPRPPDPRRERLVRDRHPADRCAVRHAGERACSYLTEMGPVGRILQQADDELRARVVATRPARVRSVRAWCGSPLQGGVLDGRRPA